jgi:tripartite-type tricarboxylate transporter receptor subunit TctC
MPPPSAASPGATLPRRAVVRALAALPVLAALGSPRALAQSFPGRPVRIVVPYSVGLGPDIVARAVAESMAQSWRQNVVVENRPGASGIVALSEVRRVPADGHTLFVGDAGSMCANPSLYANLPYDPRTDFAPVSTLFRATFVLWTGAGNRIDSLRTLIAEAKAHPGKVSYGSFGAGHPSQLAVETFAERAGIRMLHVPFKEAGALTAAIANGDVDVTVLSVNSMGSLAKAGRVRALAVGSRRRLPDQPDIPTIAEAGGPAVELAPWAALFAAAGTPQPVVDTLHREVLSALRNPDIRGRIEGLGFQVQVSSPQELAQLVRADSELYAGLVRTRGLKPE